MESILDTILDLLRVIPEVLSGPTVILIIALIFKDAISELLKTLAQFIAARKGIQQNEKPASTSQGHPSSNEISSQVHQNLAQAFAMKGSYDEAIAQYKATINIDPENASAYIGLGNAYHKKGMYEEAIRALEKAVEIKPYWADARCNLGAAYSLLGIHNKAIDEFVQAININPNYAAAHYGLGIAHISAGQYDKAQEQVGTLKRLESIFAERLAQTIEDAKTRA